IYTSLAMALVLSAGDAANAQQKKKKGMSPQAKGAVIGGATGVVAGGLIGNNVKGAVIGGALGAGGGYVIGNEQRLNKEKKAKAAKKN
ncbi:MAG: hypothetical protein EOP51_29255, partial [Sphingobacteriales bacterium]